MVESENYLVEGLLYLVNGRDEKSLDRSEGVSKRFYQKHIIKVDFEPSKRYADFTSSQIAQLLLQPQTVDGHSNSLDHSSSGVSRFESDASRFTDRGTQLSNALHGEGQEKPRQNEQVRALVYISDNYTTDGMIREEYILRMQKATSDAKVLGVSASFVDKYIIPGLVKRDIASTASLESQVVRQEKGLSSTRKRTGSSDETRGGTSDDTEAHYTKLHKGDEAKGMPYVSQNTHFFYLNLTLLSEAETPRQKAHAEDPSALNLVDFQALEHTNRSPHTQSGLTFPAQLFEVVTKTGPGLPQRRSMVYIVVEESTRPEPPFNIVATTQDLELENELAIMHFRDACSQYCPTIATDSLEHWTRVEGDDFKPGALNWKLYGGTYVCLWAIIPGVEGQVSVRVETQVVSARK